MNGIYLAGRVVPYYGLMIALGILVAGFVGYLLIRHFEMSSDELLLLAAYTVGGGLAGAKIFSMILTRDQIQWDRLLEWDYFLAVMQAGYVFYGGLIGGFLTLFVANRIHKINVVKYIKVAIPCLPIAHGFGRIGCHLAGCCYGIPYEGIGHIVYESSLAAPTGISLFPVQLFEAVCNFVIAGVLIIIVLKTKGESTLSVSVYLTLYAVLRYILEEFLRYDVEERGTILMFSTSQFISILLFAVAVGLLIFESRAKKKIIG